MRASGLRKSGLSPLGDWVEGGWKTAQLISLTVEADDPGGERNHLGRVGVSVERKAVGLLA